VVTVDLLGHGPVAWPEEELSIGQAGRRVAQLLEELGTGPAFVIGVSLGAVVGMHMAVRSPALVQGLVLVNPWSHVNEHMRSLVNRLFRLAEAGQLATHMDVFLRYLFPEADMERHGAEVERLRAMALEHDARAVAAGLRAVEVEVWEETGHFPFLEDPVRFNRRLEAFILRCLTQGGPV
jgi:pimeloyl-ACP methyl ester carboxylesterase